MSDISEKIVSTIKDTVRELYGIEPQERMVMVERPKDPKMGDYSTNIAMRLGKTVGKKPREAAEEIVAKLKEKLPEASDITIAGPGFINFAVSGSALSSCINKILDAGDAYGHSNAGKGQKVLVEYVSANPTGDLHCGHARGAAWGDSLTRVLKAAGYDVLREYYVNDAGHQIDVLAESVFSRYCELFGRAYPLPEDGYHAADIIDVAKQIREKDGDKWLDADEEERTEYFKNMGIEMKLDAIRQDLALYRVAFDSWVHERFFYENANARINAILKKMEDKGLTYEKDGALWFKSTEFGDDKDRVLRKNTGLLTYLTPDIANHAYKLERGYGKLIDLFGADHHSYVTRMKCALAALGYDKEAFDVAALFNDMDSIIRSVEEGLGVAIISEKVASSIGGHVKIVEIDEFSEERSFYMINLRSISLSPAAEAFSEYVKSKL